MKYIPIFLMILVLFEFTGCSTVSSDIFLISSLDKEEKSEILTRKGITYYEQQLSITENYLLVPIAKKYFENALNYNSENTIAQQYLELLILFIDEQVQENLTAAERYYSKENRSEQDVFNLCYYTQRAYEVSPYNYDVIDLKNLIREEQDLLIEQYIIRGNDVLTDLENETDSEIKRELYLKAYNNFGRILLLDPANNQAIGLQNGVKDSIKSIAESQIILVREHIQSNEFSRADAIIDDITFLSSKIHNYYKDDIEQLYYEKEFHRAVYYYSENNFNSADYYIRKAISLKPEEEAITFRNNLREEQNLKDRNTAFETLITDIDGLINEGHLIAASDKLNALERRTSESAKLNRIRNREEKIVGQLPTLYTSGVNSYKMELFQDAINNLEIVTTLDASYEQAADYLEKARAKQKVLDSF